MPEINVIPILVSSFVAHNYIIGVSNEHFIPKGIENITKSNEHLVSDETKIIVASSPLDDFMQPGVIRIPSENPPHVKW